MGRFFEVCSALRRQFFLNMLLSSDLGLVRVQNLFRYGPCSEEVVGQDMSTNDCIKIVYLTTKTIKHTCDPHLDVVIKEKG